MRLHPARRRFPLPEQFMVRLVVLVFLATISPYAVMAQSPGQPGAAPPATGGAATSERPATSDRQVDEGQLMTLPSVGNAGRSAAPTMVFDCAKRPQECTNPAQPGDASSAPAISTKP
jgi:hypothetical protein